MLEISCVKSHGLRRWLNDARRLGGRENSFRAANFNRRANKGKISDERVKLRVSIE